MVIRTQEEARTQGCEKGKYEDEKDHLWSRRVLPLWEFMRHVECMVPSLMMSWVLEPLRHVTQEEVT